MTDLALPLTASWHYWLVGAVLIVAAVIDGVQLRVPNWLTYPMIVSGWAYSALAAGYAGDGWYVGLGWSLLGTAVGLGLLLPLHAVGGMGAGDVKLLAGIGAWVLVTHTMWAFVATALVGALMAVVMVATRKAWAKHSAQFWRIVGEFMTVRNPDRLSEIAAERKPRMLLLPYGIPMCVGTIGYFILLGVSG